MINLSVPNLSMDILDNLKECLESGWVSTGGRFIPEFETKVKNYMKTKCAAGVQSGTAGLHMSLQVLGVSKRWGSLCTNSNIYSGSKSYNLFRS